VPVLELLAYPPWRPEHGGDAPAASYPLARDADAGVRAADILEVVDVYVPAFVASAYFPVRLVLEEMPSDLYLDFGGKDTQPSMATEQTFPSFQEILETCQCYAAVACSPELFPCIWEEEREDFSPAGLELVDFRALNVHDEVCRLGCYQFLSHHILCVFLNVYRSLGSDRGTMERGESWDGNVMMCCLGFGCGGLEMISIA